MGHLTRVHEVEPWQFGRRDYLAAVVRPSLALGGNVTATPWDAALAPTMNDTGLAVHEECLLDVLLADLG
jgi:hypothetical protein